MAKNYNPFHFKHYAHDELLTFIAELGHFRLLEWFGQNIYIMKQGKISGTLPEHEMNLQCNIQGQIQFYIFHKA